MASLFSRSLAALLLLGLSAGQAYAADGPAVAGIPVEFLLFALTLLGVALFHHQTFYEIGRAHV